MERRLSVCLSVRPSVGRPDGEDSDRRPPLSGVVPRSPAECRGMLPDVLTTGSWQTSHPVTDTRDDLADLPRRKRHFCAVTVGLIVVFYYRAMLRRARLCHSKSSVRPSVRLSVGNVQVCFSHRLKYFQNNSMTE